MSGKRAKMSRFPYIKQNSIAEIVSTMESFLVAGEGLEPTTFGLSVPALCGARKLSGAPSRTSPPSFDRGSFRAFLLPPPAAVGTKTQRATLVVLITKGHSCKSFLVNEELGNRKCDFRVLWQVAPKKISMEKGARFLVHPLCL